MSCSVCGDICRCSSQENSTGSSLAEPEAVVNSDAIPHVESGSRLPGGGGCVPDDSSSWRQEVAARLNRYQSRRKPRAPRYPSLRLRFEPPETRGIPAEPSTLPPVLTSNHALVLDEFAPTLPEPLSAATTHSAGESGTYESGGGCLGRYPSYSEDYRVPAFLDASCACS